MPPKVIFLVGRPGSGKGTQVGFLKEKSGFEVIRTGEKLREKAQEKDIIGEKVAEVLAKGGLIPTPVVFSIWMPLITEFHQKETKGLIFDGNPRKLYEAKMLEELFTMLNWESPILFHLKISEEEAYQRLQKRGRDDDRREDIKERLKWFKEEVEPVIDYYTQKGKLIEVNGEQSVEEVWREMEKKVEEDIIEE